MVAGHQLKTGVQCGGFKRKAIQTTNTSDIQKCMDSKDHGWDLYRTFLAVVREGSLSAAARRLGIAQPTAGRHVRALEKNVGALLRQEYPDYEVIFVTASANDLSVPLLRLLAAQTPERKVKFVTAGVSEERGEKVHNLSQAADKIAAESVVYVFTDSDSRAPSNWLRQLVSPLRDEGLGACTGYRWFFPVRGNFASVLRSAWNGSVATLLRDHDHNFAWGGSMAIRRATFERAQVLRYWKHSISDDYSLARALNATGFKICYEPRCLIPSHGDCSWRELLEWSTRQILITKIYSRRLWQLALVSQFPFLAGWWWGLGGLILGFGQFWAQSAGGLGLTSRSRQLGAMIGVIYLLGALRGLWRLRAVNLIFREQRHAVNRFWWGYVLLAPLVSTLTGYNLLVSLLTSTLEWRGVRYELKSAEEVRVVRSE
jgi:cellulose synthase/poly-beta-1,6-N-acetylglucosamine synthase-like glycosyltransferase